MADTAASKKKKGVPDESDSLTPAKKRMNYESNFVTFKTGEEASVSTIHETLLKENSDFFKAALEKQWKESKTRVINLRHDEHEVVLAYIHYLYSKEVPLDTLTDKNGSEIPSMEFLAELYCFGEKVLDDKFCDAVLEVFIAGCTKKFPLKCGAEKYWIPGLGAVAIIYAGTPANSHIRKFLAYTYAQAVRSGWDLLVPEPCLEFLRDVTIEMSKLREAPNIDICHRNLLANKEKWMKTKH